MGAKQSVEATPLSQLRTNVVTWSSTLTIEATNLALVSGPMSTPLTGKSRTEIVVDCAAAAAAEATAAPRTTETATDRIIVKEGWGSLRILSSTIKRSEMRMKIEVSKTILKTMGRAGHKLKYLKPISTEKLSLTM